MTDVDKLIKRRDQLNARIQLERSKENKRKRKYDTRAKILLGSSVIGLLEREEMLDIGDGQRLSARQLAQALQKRLTEKDRERLIFCLQNRG